MMSSAKLDYFNFLQMKFIADRETNESGDVIQIQIDDEVFRCHRYILAANSEYFAAVFRNNFNDGRKDKLSLSADHVNGTIFPKILDAMYGGAFRIEVDDVIPIYGASLYLQLTYFINLCSEYIRKNIENLDVLELIVWPQLRFNVSLYTFVKKFICRNFPKFATCMVRLPLEVVQELLSDLALVVPKKEFVISFCRSWIMYDPEQRKQHLATILSILKPFNGPRKRTLHLDSTIEDIRFNYRVKVALNTLLELPDNERDQSEHELPQSSQIYENKCTFHSVKSLFFAQPNRINCSDLQIATYLEDSMWNFYKHLKLPVMNESWTKYEGAVIDKIFYTVASINDAIVFRGFNAETQEWVELMTPENLSESLICCNSTLYSYESSFDANQFSYYEPVLNRWFKLPPAIYPRQKAGVTSNESVLYVIGGKLQVQPNNSHTPNIIEMYDNRCGFWSSITAERTLTINYIPYSKRVCCLNDKIYLFVPEGKNNLSCFDVRNNKWPYFEERSLAEGQVGYAVAVDPDIWFVLSPTNGIRVFDSYCKFTKESYNFDVRDVKPISLQQRI